MITSPEIFIFLVEVVIKNLKNLKKYIDLQKSVASSFFSFNRTNVVNNDSIWAVKLKSCALC